MPTLACLSCDFKATTRTRKALLKKLSEHAAAAHNVPALPADVIDNVELAMKRSATDVAYVN